MAKVLLIEDEVTMLQVVTEILRSEGHEVFPFNNFETGMAALETHAPELVITDLYLAKGRAHGLEVLEKARTLNPPATVIVVTGFATIETAVDAMKMGAYDYVEKPFKVDELKLTVQRALSYNEAVSENVYLRKQLKKKYQFSQIIGNSAKMQEVFKMIERVSGTDSTVLILGESGTGKELVARALHFNSNRQFAPFIPINCSALPESLLESELFGHRKGSFTGALNDKKGLFHEADGGTIFLDEIGSMSQTLQSRFLRVLQEREVRRIGDTIATHVNVRVLAATHEPLEKKIKEGLFREDLYYRLNVISINLPGLRERLEDIPLLAAHFLKDKVHVQTGKQFQVTKRAMHVLCNYDWPGNVRELENALERASVLCDEAIIKVADLPPIVRDSALKDQTAIDEAEIFTEPSAAVLDSAVFTKTNGSLVPPVPAHRSMPSLKMFMREQEVVYLNRVMAHAEGDKERAAEILGVSPTTLYRKLSEDDLAS